MKLIDAHGLRPWWLKTEGEAHRVSVRAEGGDLPSQNFRVVSRNLSFHSAHPGGKPPTWYPPGPQSQGSAMSLTLARHGSWLHALRKPLWLSNPFGSRARMVPRSKRKPSTRVCSAQYRRLSVTIWITRAWLRFSVFPVPVSL